MQITDWSPIHLEQDLLAALRLLGSHCRAIPWPLNAAGCRAAQAAALTLKTLQFFWHSPQGKQPDATGYKGFYYHFLDMQSGRRVWQCELSLVDTALLMAGILTVGLLLRWRGG